MNVLTDGTVRPAFYSSRSWHGARQGRMSEHIAFVFGEMSKQPVVETEYVDIRTLKIWTVEANPMICPDCGLPMNHHADGVQKETDPDDVSAFDSGLGGVIEEFHTCPQCGKTRSRRAAHSETS